MNGQWIKLHRKAIDSQVFSDPELWKLFCWCLMSANWRPGWFLGTSVPVGSFATGRDAAADFLKMSPSTWYKRMKKLQEFGVISLKSNNRFTLITVEKWLDYQGQTEKGNNQVTTKEQPGNNQVTTKEQPSNTIEEGKEYIKKNKKNKNTLPSAEFLKWYELYPKKVSRGAAIKAYDAAIVAIMAEDECDRAEAVEALQEWTEQLVPTLLETEVQFIPMPSTWLNNQRYRDAAVKQRVLDMSRPEFAGGRS